MLEFPDSGESKLLHERTTSRIIGAAFEVHDQLGYGFLERVSLFDLSRCAAPKQLHLHCALISHRNMTNETKRSC
jgi:hypothetical protein